MKFIALVSSVGLLSQSVFGGVENFMKLKDLNFDNIKLPMASDQGKLPTDFGKVPANTVKESSDPLKFDTAAKSLNVGDLSKLSDPKLDIMGKKFKYTPRVREYFVQAEVRDWTYVDGDTNQVSGQPYTAHELVFLEKTSERIGSAYQKLLYIEYTDSTFTTERVRPADEAHLGFLGPILRCAVGDTMRIQFSNTVPSSITTHLSMHPHGLAYKNIHEGALYVDGDPTKLPNGNMVPSGQTWTYEWYCTDDSGPTSTQFSSIIWAYHSHVKTPEDINAGLVGAIIVTDPERGFSNEEEAIACRPNDVDREIIAFMNVFDENSSWLLDSNLAAAGIDSANWDALKEDGDFQESNLMHAINGKLYGWAKGMDSIQGERVRWYNFGMGTEVDVHEFHWHGNTVTTDQHQRRDTLAIIPAEMRVADMSARNAGMWLFHCHTHDHIAAGMETQYVVKQIEAEAVPAPDQPSYKSHIWV